APALYARVVTKADGMGTIRTLALSAIVLVGFTAGLGPSAGAAAQARPTAAMHSAAAAHATAQHAPPHHPRPQNPAPQTTPPATAAGALSGTVLGAGGVPLARACVTVTGTASTRAARTVVTDTAGRYMLEGLVPGSYTIGFSDCADPARYFREWYGGSFTVAGAEHVTVLPGHSISLGPVTLRPTNPQTAIAAQQRPVLEHPRQASAHAPPI